RRGHIQSGSNQVEDPGGVPEFSHTETPAMQERRSQLMQGLLIDPLSINFGIVGVAIVIGWLMLQGLIWIESVTWGVTGFEVMTYVPLFPMALVGGIVVQVVLERLGLEPLVIQPLMKNIAGVALDVVVVTALASISLQVLGNNIGIFLVLSIFGIAWNLLFFLYYAPRIFPDYWFEKGIGDLGQSMGVTATGILLLRMVDHRGESGAFESFAYKQLFFEPIVGGGLFTAAAPTLIARFGLGGMMLITGGLLAFWLVMGGLLMKQNQRQRRLQRQQQPQHQEMFR
ncbi:MAG: sodium:glutamate symporter, partial [Cyanobacteria bacterium J06636_16]